jgi:hypothetical protein
MMGFWLVLQEDEGTKEAKNHQLLTEDIDSILARAEVRGHTDYCHSPALLLVHSA